MSKSPPDDLGQTYLHRLSVAANTLMSTGFWLTTGVFGVLTIISILGGQFQQIISIESLVWKLIISSYFVSWVVGVKFDKTREEYVYNTAPSQVKLDITSIILAAVVFLLFGIMYVIDGLTSYTTDDKNTSFIVKTLVEWLSEAFISNTQAYMATHGRYIILILLNVLWFFNIPLWMYFLHKYINPMSSDAKSKCRRDGNILGLEKISIVDQYIGGRWQTYRFVIGSIILIFVDAELIIYSYPNPFTPLSLIICGYLLFIEAWAWLMRAQMKYAIQSLDRLSEQYYLTRRGPERPIRSPRRTTRLKRHPATKTEDANIPPTGPEHPE